MVNFMKPPRRLVAKVGAVYGVALLFAGLLLTEQATAACRVSLSQPLIDYGLLRDSDQPSAQGVSLGKRTVRLNVICAEAAVIALRFQGAPAEGQGYRLGRQGYFNLTLQQPMLDGKPVELAQLYNPAERAGTLQPGQPLVVLAGGMPAIGRTFSALVQVESWLSGVAIAVRDKTTLEGSGRFEVVPAG